MIPRLGYLIALAAVQVWCYEPVSTARFLNFLPGVRAAGVGEAYTALGEDLDVLAYNPAGIAFARFPSLGVVHWEGFQDLRHSSLGFDLPQRFGHISGSIKVFYLSGLERRTGPTEEPEGYFGEHGILIGAHYAQLFKSRLSLGAGLKGVYLMIDEYAGTSLAADLGTQFWLWPNKLKLGASVTDLGPDLKLNTRHSPLPGRLRLGLAYQLLGRTPVAGVDWVKPLWEDGWGLRFGVEYSYQTMLGIRFGYRLSQLDHADGLSFGIGLSPGNLEIGYAFLPQGPLGLSHEIGIGYRFKPAPPRAITEALRAKEQLTSQAFYEQGCRYQLDAQYDDAAQAFELALIWDPENQTAQDKLSEVNELHRKELIQTRLERGRELYEASKLFDALRELKEAAALDSLNPEVRDLLDRIRKELDLEAAQQSQAVKSQLDAGLAHYSRGNYRLALKSYQDVLKIEPGNPTAQRYLLEIQTELDSLSQESLKRAEHYIDRGQWARAITELNQGLRLDPESPALKLKLSEVSARVSKEKSQCLSEGIEKFQAKKYAEAVQKFHEVLRLAPGDPTAQEYLKRINRSSVSQDPYTLYLAGIKAYTDEDYELAISYWEQVLRLDPKFERARENLKRARSKLALLEGS